MSNIQFSVFTKPWRHLSSFELGKSVKEWGFDGLEFPLREGYQVEPQDAAKGLPRLVKEMSDFGLKIFSVASSTDEAIFAACAEAQVPLIRIMAPVDRKLGYLASESKLRSELEKLIPLCEKYKVKVGVQQHHGDNICDSTGLVRLLESLDPRHIGAVWDAAHDALAGQQPEIGLPMVKSHLFMVNLKNVWYMKTGVPKDTYTEWTRYFTTGNCGLASWPRVADTLKSIGYQGVVCLTAQYNSEEFINSYIQSDLKLAKSLF